MHSFRSAIAPAAMFARLTSAVLVALLPAATFAADHTSTWNGSSGNWTDTTRWTTPTAPGTFPNNGSPTPTYDAILNGGVITVNQDVVIQKLTQSGGTNSGTGFALTTNELLTLSGGVVSGTGTIHVLGGAVIGPVEMSGRTLNFGDGSGPVVNTTWSSGDPLVLGGLVINNRSDSNFIISFDGGSFRNINRSGSVVFSNQGTFTKNGGAGTANIGETNNGSSSFAFNNSGTVVVNTGKLVIGSNGGYPNTHTSTGTFQVADVATLELAGSHTLSTNSLFTGAGTVNFSGGVTATAATTVNTSLTLSGSLGGSGPVTVNGNLLLTGSMNGGNATALGDVTIAMASQRVISGGAVLNLGDGAGPDEGSTTAWSSGNIDLQSNGTVNNRSDSVINATANGTMSNTHNSSTTAFNNQGTFNQNGTGTTTLGAGQGPFVFQNSGLVQVNSGTLVIAGTTGTNNTGSFAVAGGATLNLGGSMNLNAGTTFTGAGTVVFSGGITMNTPITVNPHLTITGTLGGTSPVTAAGNLTFSGGMINDGGNLTALGSVLLNGGDRQIGNAVLNLGDGAGPDAGSTTTWSAGNFTFSGRGGVALNNRSDSVLTTTFDGKFTQIYNGDPASSVINNAGVFTKSGGAGSTVIGDGFYAVTFTNSGTVNANSGTIRFNHGYTQTAGALVLNGGTVNRNGGNFDIRGGKLQGGGTVTGGVTATGGTIHIEPGIGTTPGALTITGDLTLTSGSKLSFDIGGTTPGTEHDKITEGGSGAPNVTGVTLEVNLLNGFIPAAGTELIVLDASHTISGSFANVANGARLPLPGGLYSCKVSYGASSSFADKTQVILSEFATTPTSLELDDNEIVENATGGSTVGLLSATDPDTNETFSFTLVSGTGSTDNGFFQITGNQLQTKALPTPTVVDFETKTSYSVRLRVTNSRGGFLEQNFTLQVLDVPAPSSLDLDTLSVPENQPLNTVIGTLTATDPMPGATFTYELPDSADRISLNILDDKLRSSKVFDKEGSGGFRGPFTARVRVTSSSGEFLERTFTITVDDQGPSNITLSPAFIPEGRPAGTPVGTLSATVVPEGTGVTYSLVGGIGSTHNAQFMVEGALIKTTAELHVADGTERSIRVRATDANGEIAEQILTITVQVVQVTDILLAPPSVKERLPAGTEVGLLTAVATPEGLPATFELVAGDGDDDNLLFAINGGVLETTVELDEEEQDMRNVRVRTTVSGISFEKALVIQVLDNDPNLVLEHPEGTVLAVFPAGDAVQFPVTEAGMTSEPKVFTIRNTGTGPLKDIEIPGMNHFTVDVTGMAEEVAPGETTTFTVSFSPQTPAATTGPESAVGENMLILSNDPDSGMGGDEFSLSGRAMTAATLAIEQPAGTVINDGSSLYFGLGLIGADGAPRTFTLTNSGEAPVRGLAVSLQGVHEGSFVLDAAGVPDVLPGGGSTTFTVLMHPEEEGALTATLRIRSDSFGDTDINLNGEGLTPEQIAHQAYVKASNTDSGDQFGYSVAVDGDTVVIGARAESSNARGINGDQGNDSSGLSGAAYVLVRTGGAWVQQAYLKASNTDSGDDFGVSVAIEGDTIVVGAAGERSAATGVNGNEADNTAFQAGAAYVFIRQNGVWSQQAYLKASDTSASAHFGFAVAISGETVAVGAHGAASFGSSTGAVYVFTRSGAVWSQEGGPLRPGSSGDGNDFGWSIALDGDLLVAGAPGDDSSIPGINQGSDDDAEDAGAAYVFQRSGGNWGEQAMLKASNAESGDGFGRSVAISGGIVVVGAFNEDSAARGVNGDQASNGAPDSGAAYVFALDGFNWQQEAYLKASNTGDADRFGYSVAIHRDRLAVGAFREGGSGTGVDPLDDDGVNRAGAVYLFRRAPSFAPDQATNFSWVQNSYLKASNTDAFDSFGLSLALSEEHLIVGAPQEDSAATGVDGDGSDNSATIAGAAYIFALESRAIQVYAGAELTADRVHSGQAAPVDLGGSPPAVPLTRTFTILNDGLLPLDISAVHVSGDFFVVDQGDPALPGFGAMQFTVQNEPGTSGPLNGTVQIESDDPDLPLFTFTLAGLVGDAPPTEIAIEQPEGANLTDGASTVNYGALTYSRTAARAFTVRNLGTQPLYIGAITITGADMADFAAGPPGQSEVQPGQATSFMVTFDPTGTVGGSRTAVLHVFSNDTDEGSFDITLTGTVQVPDIEVTGGTIVGGVPTLDFGTVVFGPGKPGRDLAIGVFNVGQGVLEDFNFNIEGVHASDFSIINSAIFTSFGGAAQLAVRFLPQEEGPRSAVLRVESNDPDENPLLINLAGNGNALPVITQQPQSVLVFTGESVTFTAAATGSGLTYQWLKDGIPFGSATPSLTIPNVLATSKGTYSCRVSNSAGVTFSSVAHLAVMASSPAPFPVQANEDTTNILSMASVSPPAQTKILYHWQKDGADLSDGGTAPVISGAFTRSLRLTGVKPASSGTYTCKVTLISSNGGGNLTRVGRTIVLTVGAKPVIAAGGPFEWGAATPVSDVITVTQNPGGIRYSGHPTGVRLSITGAGQLTFQGKPTRIGSGTITVTASNAAGTSLPQTFNYTVAALPANVVGTFDGLVDRSSLFGLHNLGGKISVTVGSNGSWSAALLLGPKVYSLTASPATSNTRFSGGIFSGRAVVNRSSEGLPSLNLDIEIDASTGNLTGTLTDAALTSPQPGEVALEAFKGSVLPQFSYTAALEVSSALAGNPSVPQGNGFFTAKAGSNSTLTMAFKLADSTVKTYAGPVVAGARIPVFFSLYGNVPSSAGSVHGWITRTADTVPQVNGGRPLLNGALTWLKHPQPSSSTTRSYKEGFPLHTLTVLGGQYAPPPAGSVVLGLQAKTSNARFAFAEGGIEFSALGGSGSPAGTPAGIIRQVCTISTSNLLTLPAINTAQNPANVRVNSFDAATGLFRGTFILRDNDPTDLLPPITQLSRNTAFEGVLVPRLDRGAGFFNLILLPVPGRTLSTMPMLSGQVILEANP
ncbi:MAG TPA: choice-of-anchor D domain-containing protein [Prosthecobacter sp.]|nr:choice-of-anchor D domain-containing protein [Prosthecobacter sp.]